jgi:uncharacterized damage-inducible protein DinB
MEKTFLDSLVKLYTRDLDKLEGEIAAYTGESTLWKTDGDIKNAAGNLCLHLCGNLQHYIGNILGGTAYVRNRPLEFAAKNIPQQELLATVRQTRSAVIAALEHLDKTQLQKEYPEKVFDYPMTTLYFLIHLQGHLNYHLGQINYHRRLLG